MFMDFKKQLFKIYKIKSNQTTSKNAPRKVFGIFIVGPLASTIKGEVCFAKQQTMKQVIRKILKERDMLLAAFYSEQL